jgi:hypothetical protein
VPEHLIMYIYEAPTSTAGRYNYFPNRVTRWVLEKWPKMLPKLFLSQLLHDLICGEK